MDDATVEKTIREYLPQIVHLSLATSDNGKPWVCEVHFAFDADLNLYFRSMPDRRHSLEIDKNANVAGNIVTQHFLNQKPRGVYFEGIAEKLVITDDQHVGFQTYVQRYGKGPELLADITKDDGSRLYKITVSDWYVFDAYTSNPAQKYHLAWGA